MKIVYLHPLSGYATNLRSDTLWGLLCWGIRHLWGTAALEQFIQAAAAGDPEFVLSSTFPYKRYGRDFLPFFPNPLRQYPEQASDASPSEAAILRKRFRRVEYLSAADLSAVLQGRYTNLDLLERLRKAWQQEEAARQRDELWVPNTTDIEQWPPDMEVFSMTHNTIDRIRGGTLRRADADGEPAGQLFHADEIYWADPYSEDQNGPNTGLFFLADGDTSKLEALLRLYRHHGLGADRSTGKGFFDYHIAEFDPGEAPVQEANALYTLSLYAPTAAEINQLTAAPNLLQYRLEARNGHIGFYPTNTPKQTRRYFAEGAVLPRPAGHRGRWLGGLQTQPAALTDTLQHPVWDNGFAFTLNLKWTM
jgi:CRISPR-associated protein Csm4